MSAPAAFSMRAISTASAGVMPSAPTQSVAEMRTEIGLSCGQTARTACEHLERKAHAVVEAAAVVVGALVGERRDEGRQQIAVRVVQLEPVEAGARGHLGRRARTRRAPCPCRRASSRAASGWPATSGRAMARSAPSCRSASGASISSQPSCVEPLGPAWPSWIAIFASVSACTKSTMRRQAASCSGA